MHRPERLRVGAAEPIGEYAEVGAPAGSDADQGLAAVAEAAMGERQQLLTVPDHGNHAPFLC